MNSIKCKKCSVMNFSDAVVCARCGAYLLRMSSEKEKPKLRFSFAALLAFAIVGAILYYIYDGLQKSMDEVNAREANRTAVQPRQTPSGLTRTESERQHSSQVGTAIQNSNSLSQTQKHNEEIRKMTESSQGAPQK